MESIISNLLSRFEKGSLSRRELAQGLAMLAASGTAGCLGRRETPSLNRAKPLP
jgi:hypothetical protein